MLTDTGTGPQGTEAIRFGTSGWRGRIAHDFTYGNVRRLSAAIARHLRGRSHYSARVFVACDTRFCAEMFAAEAARVLVKYGHRVFLSPEHAPTPAVSALMKAGGWDAAINLTASHNPAEWLGLKFTPASGAPASPEETRAIEALIPSSEESPHGALSVESASARQAYYAALRRAVDFSCIRKGCLRLALDCMHGAALGWADGILRAEKIPFTVLHGEKDPLFGGLMPDPSGERLKALSAETRRKKAAIGIAFDGDADRFGIVDEKGRALSANLVIAMLCDYLLRHRRIRRGPLARSAVTTHLVDAVARLHGVDCLETPVGFKHIGALFLKGGAVAGGEESGGFSTAAHLPEKDGILAGFLAAEMVARERKPLSALARDFYRRAGGLRVSGRLDVPVAEPKRALEAARTLHRVGPFEIREKSELDGVKWLLGGGAWMALRSSGTEPLMRLYAEASSEKQLAALLSAGGLWLKRAERIHHAA